MLYCLVENGTLTDGPREIPVAWRHVSGLNHLSDAELAQLGWLPATTQEATFDPLTQKLGAAEVTIGEAAVSVVYPAIVLDASEALANLKAYAAQKRFEVETGGITIAGVAVATDRESQSLINGAYSAVQRDPQRVIDWKGANGFVLLDAAAVTSLADAVAAHVQAAFATEATVSAMIDAGLTVDRAGVDAAAWPA